MCHPTLKLPSLFTAWFFWTFQKVLVVLSHLLSPFFTLNCLYWRKWTFMGPCAPFWNIFGRKNSPHINIPTLTLIQWWETFTKLFLSNIMIYDKSDVEWHKLQISLQNHTGPNNCLSDTRHEAWRKLQYIYVIGDMWT